MSEWLVKAIIAMLFLLPAFFATPVAHRHFGVRPEIMLVYWVLGIMIGTTVWLGSRQQLQLLIPSAPALVVGAIGLTAGTIANICMFKSFAPAPNPGLTVAIVGTNSAVAYVLTPVLAFALPQYFHTMEFTWQHLVGILFVVVGIAFIVTKQ